MPEVGIGEGKRVVESGDKRRGGKEKKKILDVSAEWKVLEPQVQCHRITEVSAL